MNTIDEILSLVQPIGKKLMNVDFDDLCDLSYKEDMTIDKYYRKLPDLNPVYIPAIKHRTEVAVHAVKGTFPYELLKSKAPNQNDEEWNFQRKLFQQITFPTWGRAENKTKIIGNSQNYSITGWDEEQKKYFYTDYPSYSSMFDYFFEVVRKRKINFPNQVMLLRPESIPYKQTDEGWIVDQTKKINWIVDVVDEFHKASYKEGKHLLVIDDERVLIENQYYYQFDLYTDMWIFKIKPLGFNPSTGQIDYTVLPILEHGWGYCPAQELKGEMQDNIKGNSLYYSIFSFAIPRLNDATRLNSNLSISEYSAAFPTRIRLVDKCSFKNDSGQSCIDGKIWDTEGAYKTCPSCHGTGEDSSITPGGEIRVKMYSSQIGGGATQLAMSPPMQYVAPDVAIYTHLDTRIKDMLREAFGFILDSEKATNETATGKALEKEEFYSSLVQFSNELFGLIKFAIEGIGFFMFTKTQDNIGKDGSFKMPVINKPKTFNFRDAGDLTAEIADARKNNMPAPYIYELLEEYSSTRFNTDEEAKRFTDFMVYCDRVWDKDDLTIASMVGRTLSKTEAIVHSSFTTFVEQAIVEDAEFMKGEFNVMKDKIFELAQVVADNLKASNQADNQMAADFMTGQ